MKANKQFVQEVANGKYSDYDIHGEMQKSARMILENKVVSKFSTFCFRMFGGDIPDNIGDVYDAFVDFAIHGARIDIDVSDGIYRFHTQIFGATAEETLGKLWEMYSCCEDQWIMNQLENMKFKIKGEPGLYEMNQSALHSVYDHGRAPQRYAVKACRVA